jgi:hypothetical protein
MDLYKVIEVTLAEEYGSVARQKKKAIGDFLLDANPKKPVNVKSNNLNKKNYSPNLISAVKLLRWLKVEGNELYFLFVDYTIDNDDPIIVRHSGLIPVHHISWKCLTIEAQGWGVIQKYKPLHIIEEQDLKTFLKGLRAAYEKYLLKEQRKAAIIRSMISDL